MKIKRRNSSLPGLSMTAMPDLIFTILFFFMIVTHIRESSPQLQYQEPEGANLQKLKKNTAVIDVFIGRKDGAGEYEIQVGNAVTSLQDLPSALRKECEGRALCDEERFCVSLQADRETPMYIINKVKAALRDARILKINYGGTDCIQPFPPAGNNK